MFILPLPSQNIGGQIGTLITTNTRSMKDVTVHNIGVFANYWLSNMSTVNNTAWLNVVIREIENIERIGEQWKVPALHPARHPECTCTKSPASCMLFAKRTNKKIFFLLFKLIKLKCEIYVLYEFKIMVKILSPIKTPFKCLKIYF